MCETTVTYTYTSAECSYCGCYHAGVCSRIEEIEYYPDGTVKRVRFKQLTSGIYWKNRFLTPLDHWCNNCGFCKHEADKCPHKCCFISAHCGCFSTQKMHLKEREKVI